jgi:hypothetical protein
MRFRRIQRSNKGGFGVSGSYPIFLKSLGIGRLLCYSLLWLRICDPLAMGFGSLVFQSHLPC